jgi:hypothetical protein
MPKCVQMDGIKDCAGNVPQLSLSLGEGMKWILEWVRYVQANQVVEERGDVRLLKRFIDYPLDTLMEADSDIALARIQTSQQASHRESLEM